MKLARLKDFVSILTFFFGVLLIAASGVGGLFFVHTSTGYRFVGRAAIFLLGVECIILHVRYWSTHHHNALISSPLSTVDEPEFRPLAGADALAAIEDSIRKFSLASGTEAIALAQIIASPSVQRRRISETVSFESLSIQRSIRLEYLAPHGVNVGDSTHLIVVSRPDKGRRYAQLQVFDSSNRRLPLVTFTACLGIVFQCCLALIEEGIEGIGEHYRPIVMRRLADIISNTNVSAGEASSFADQLITLTGLDDLAAEIRAVVIAAATKRPIFAISHTGPLNSIEYRYIARVRQASFSGRDYAYDWWRRWKELLRRRLLLPAKFVELDIGRGRTTDVYQFYATVPSGLYIEEAAVVTQSGLVENMQPDVLRTSYVGWTPASGRSDIALGAAQLKRSRVVKTPVLILRLAEKPPGSLATCVLVAATVVLTSWFTGALVNQSGPSGTDVPGIGTVDLAALGLSLPSIATSWLGLRRSQVSGAYRSVSGFISLLVSSLLSLATITIYIGRFATKLARIPLVPLRGGESYFDITDSASAAIVLIGLVNFTFVSTLLISRTARYLALKTTLRT